MQIKSCLKQLSFIVLLIIPMNSYAKNCDTKQLDQLFSLIAQRNEQMKSIAMYKYVNNKELFDANQELKVLQNSQLLATKLNLDQISLLTYVQLQMDLSKQIQSYWIQSWKNNPNTAPNSKNTPNIELTRNQIKIIDDKLYPQIKSNINNFKQCSLSLINKHYEYTTKNTQGMPTNINYNQLILNALLQIK